MKSSMSVLVATAAVLLVSVHCQQPAPAPDFPSPLLAPLPGAIMPQAGAIAPPPGTIMPQQMPQQGAIMPQAGAIAPLPGAMMPQPGAVMPQIGGLGTIPAVPGPVMLPAATGTTLPGGQTVTQPGVPVSPPPPGSASAGQAGPTVNPSPSTTMAPPTTTSAPIAPPTVAFISRLPIDTPNTFATGRPNGAKSGPTYAQAWCINLSTQFPGSLCSATATAGSVNVQTVMTFPVSASNPNAAAQATQLTQTLQAIATNPAVAASLFPASLGVGTVSVSGISVSGSFAAAAPAPAPMVMPVKPVARIVSFLARLTTYGQPSDFTTTLQMQWCAQLNTKYPSAQCAVTQVTPGSVNVATSMGFPANDNSASALYSQLEAIASNSGSSSDLFGTAFGQVTVTSVADSNNAPATTASTPSPAPASHHLSGGKIAGAVIGSVAGAALLAGCGYGGYKYYKTRQSRYSPANMA